MDACSVNKLLFTRTSLCIFFMRKLASFQNISVQCGSIWQANCLSLETWNLYFPTHFYIHSLQPQRSLFRTRLRIIECICVIYIYRVFLLCFVQFILGPILLIDSSRSSHYHAHPNDEWIIILLLLCVELQDNT